MSVNSYHVQQIGGRPSRRWFLVHPAEQAMHGLNLTQAREVFHRGERRLISAGHEVLNTYIPSRDHEYILVVRTLGLSEPPQAPTRFTVHLMIEECPGACT